ncbi:MAG: hypothetical protein C0504_09265 [Candidatus Solibacter sp.]|nr:hypothetical protein [Candidatus Solibacter sp.]
MERRREHRHRADQAVTLWVIGETETGQQAHIEEISGIGARLRTPVRIPLGAPVRVEWDESMYLGECVHCANSADGGYMAGIHFEQVLECVGDIRRMMESLMAESVKERPDSGTTTEPCRRCQNPG